MYVLESLWDVSDRMVRDKSEYQKIAHQGVELSEKITAMLSEEGKRYFEKYHYVRADVSTIEEQDSFIRGVRLGARFILDVLGEYRSQLPLVEELNTGC